MSKERTIVFSDGSKGHEGDFPIAIVYTQEGTYPDGTEYKQEVVDPVFEGHVTRNLYGRIMTLVEATTETARLKAVKNVFSKELLAWENDVYSSSREIAHGGAVTPNNVYLRD